MNKGIRVNGVAPGPIWSPLIPASFDEEETAKFGSEVQMQRAGQPCEVAPSYVFLASNAFSSYITGQVVHPNGNVVLLICRVLTFCLVLYYLLINFWQLNFAGGVIVNS